MAIVGSRWASTTHETSLRVLLVFQDHLREGDEMRLLLSLSNQDTLDCLFYSDTPLLVSFSLTHSLPLLIAFLSVHNSQLYILNYFQIHLKFCFSSDKLGIRAVACISILLRSPNCHFLNIVPDETVIESVLHGCPSLGSYPDPTYQEESLNLEVGSISQTYISFSYVKPWVWEQGQKGVPVHISANFNSDRR